MRDPHGLSCRRWKIRCAELLDGMVVDVILVAVFQLSDDLLAKLDALYLIDRDRVAGVGQFEEPRHLICRPLRYRGCMAGADAPYRAGARGTEQTEPQADIGSLNSPGMAQKRPLWATTARAC
jgi:hypothetical protein